MSQKTYDRLIHSHRGIIAGTMRDVILPAILGKETDGILYWIGKDLAREYPVATIDDLITLTEQLGMGTLKLRRHNATQHIWRLSGPIVEERLAVDKEETSFSLESGFLAQELEFQLGAITEAEVIEHRRSYVEILAQNDPKSDVDSERTELAEFITIQHPQSDEEQPVKKRRFRRHKKASKDSGKAKSEQTEK